MFRMNIAANEIGFGEFAHLREPVAAEDLQQVIRANQGMLYSGLVLDLSTPAEIVLPEIDGRYQSMLVISQDHYMIAEATLGTYPLTEDKVGSRFALALSLPGPECPLAPRCMWWFLCLRMMAMPASRDRQRCASRRVLVCNGLQWRWLS